MLAIYSVGIYIYGKLIALASLFSAKARLWISGRRDLWQRVENTRFESPIWIHCSSLGEFEQGRPLIEALRKEYPHRQIVLTFFSPSGYEIRKNYPAADFILYMPLDTPGNARRFVEALNPCLAVFVKYDFWFNTLQALQHKSVPVIFISTVFEKGHFLFRHLTTPLRHIVQGTVLFVQDESSATLLQQHGFSEVYIAGDNRIDRVIQLNESGTKVPVLADLTSSRKVIVFGSIWPKDFEIVGSFISRHLHDYYFIIAPHNVDDAHTQPILDRFIESSIRWSNISAYQDQPVIVVDTIGDLNTMYQHGSLAYIGGGFGKGIHNTLEPAAAGLPVIFGPNYSKFVEAHKLIALGAARSVQSAGEFAASVHHFLDETEYLAAKSALIRFLDANKGATEKVMQFLRDSSYIN